MQPKISNCKHGIELVLALPLVLAVGNKFCSFLVVSTSVVLLWHFNLIPRLKVKVIIKVNP